MDSSPNIKYKSHFDEINLELEFNNIDLSLANAIRRISISSLPTFAFNPDNINIKTNTSVLHNQFIEQRLSLVPICMYKTDIYNLISEWNPETVLREYRIKIPSGNPKFSLRVKNDKDTLDLYNQKRRYDIENNTTINVTSEDILFHEEDTSSISNLEIRDFILPDKKSEVLKDEFKLFSSSYFLINKLKIDSESKGQELDIDLKPILGFGNKNSIYSPVGTTAFKSVQDTKVNIDKVFDYKIEQINRERMGKGLEELLEEEKQILKKEYLTLDAKRVISTNNLGKPNKFLLRFESVGILTPSQIITNSLLLLKYDLMDLYNCINLSNYLNNNKVSIDKSSSILDGIDIHIKNCDHTLGNLLSSYLQLLYTSDKAIHNYLLNFCAYKKKHPLDKNIFLRLEIKKDKCDVIINKILEYENELSQTLNDEAKSNDEKKKTLLSLFIIKKAILSILSEINSLLNDLGTIITENRIDFSIKNLRYIDFKIDNEEEINKEINKLSDEESILKSIKLD